MPNDYTANTCLVSIDPRHNAIMNSRWAKVDYSNVGRDIEGLHDGVRRIVSPLCKQFHWILINACLDEESIDRCKLYTRISLDTPSERSLDS